ncbi:MAG: META domain-containing protein [Deltaproteobacteria bacterium]|nr:META domain-containing protein [Deltaproteobacteria bacterium]
MTTFDKKLAVCAVVLVIANACFDGRDGPQADGHTNWLMCQSFEDCEISFQAVDCKDGYCVDNAGDRIMAAANDSSADSTVDGDASEDAHQAGAGGSDSGLSQDGTAGHAVDAGGVGGQSGGGYDGGDRDTGDRDGGGDAMLAGLVGRTFMLERSRGFKPVTGTTVRLSFREGGELGFSAGCNSHSGSVEVLDGHLWVASLGATEMGCAAELHDQDNWLAAFFTSGPAVALDGNRVTLTGNESTLVFLDREVADPDRALVGPLWTVDTFFENEAAMNLPLQDGPTLLFSDDGSVSVDTTCNTSTGRYSVAGGELTLSEMAYTEVACSGSSAIADEKVQAVMRDGTLSFEIEAARLTLMRGDLGLSAGTP